MTRVAAKDESPWLSSSLCISPLSARALGPTFALSCSNAPALCSRSKVRGTEEQSADSSSSSEKERGRQRERKTERERGRATNSRAESAKFAIGGPQAGKAPSRLSLSAHSSPLREQASFSLTLSLHACGPSALDRAARRKQSRRRSLKIDCRRAKSDWRRHGQEERGRALLVLFFSRRGALCRRAQEGSLKKGEVDKSTESKAAAATDEGSGELESRRKKKREPIKTVKEKRFFLSFFLVRDDPAVHLLNLGAFFLSSLLAPAREVSYTKENRGAILSRSL